MVSSIEYINDIQSSYNRSILHIHIICSFIFSRNVIAFNDAFRFEAEHNNSLKLNYSQYVMVNKMLSFELIFEKAVEIEIGCFLLR